MTPVDTLLAPAATVAEINDSRAAIIALDFLYRLELAKRYAEAVRAGGPEAEKNVLRWGAVLFPEKFTVPFCAELHGYLVSVRHEEFTNTEAPRGYAKTTIECFLIPTFQACEEPKAFQHYLNVQATNDKALAINRQIRFEFEGNELLLALYGDLVGDRWTDQQFVLKAVKDAKTGQETRPLIVFTAVSAGQSIRGINYLGIRPDYIVVDDLYDESDIANPESTEKKNDWFNGTLYLCRSKTRKTSIHLLGTAINSVDLLHKLKAAPGVKSRSFFRADFDKATVLWPENDSMEKVQADIKLIGTLIFNRECQNIRYDDASSYIKLKWLDAWEYDPVELWRQTGRVDSRHHVLNVLLCVDPSARKKEENDFTGMALVVVTSEKDTSAKEFWIEALLNERLSIVERIGAIEELQKVRAAERRIKRVRIETIAGFADFGAEAKRKLAMAVEEIDAVKDKITNLQNKSFHFENGRVHINRNIAPALKDELKHQLTTNHPKHDDIRDAVLLALENKSSGWAHMRRAA